MTVPGVARAARTAPVAASSRNRESPRVATAIPAGVGTGVARAARPSIRRQRCVPLRWSSPSTWPSSVTATTRESARASGGVTPPVRAVHSRLPVRSSMASTRPSGTACVAANTREPAMSGPPETVPGTRFRQISFPVARSSSTMLRSVVPSATTLVPIAIAPRTERPAPVRHWGRGSAARDSPMEAS